MGKIISKTSCSKCGREITNNNFFKHFSKCGLSKNRSKNPAGHKRGIPAWNKGLTKETDDRVRKYTNTNTIIVRKRVLDGWKPFRPMTNEERLSLSEKQSLHNSGGKCKWFEVSGVKVQGTWEFKLANKFNELGIVWQKPKTNNDIFKYDFDGKVKSYAPDFYLPFFNLYLEVKGFWWGRDREKMNSVLNQHQDKKIIIIEKELFEKILNATMAETVLRALV